MLNNTHNQRLMREALGNTDGEQPVTYGNARTAAAIALFVFAALLLAACNQAERATIIAAPPATVMTPLSVNAARTAVSTPPQDDAVKKPAEGNVVDMTY